MPDEAGDPARLPARRPERRGGEIAGGLVLAAGALAAAWLIEAPRVGSPTPLAAHLLAGYGVYSALILVVHAIALGTASGFPTLGPVTRDGVDGVGVRAWPGDQWQVVGIDLGLAVLGLGVLGLDLVTGRDWLPWSVLPALVGAWFGVRAGLHLSGRKLREGIWIGSGEIVHEGVDGTRRAPLSSIHGIVPVTKGATRVVLIGLDEASAQRLCPRPWRGRPGNPQRIRIEASRFGHSPDDLAGWLGSITGG